MYWKNFKPNPIESLLDRPGTTVEEVLDDKDVLQEIKSQNKRLTTFLLKPDNFSRLIDMVTVEAEEKDNEKLMYKFPYIASEVLCGEVWTILDALTLSKNLDQLFKFLEVERPSMLLATYFSRVVNILIVKKFDKLVLYFERNKHVMQNMAKKVGVFPIMELLFRMGIIEEKVDATCAKYLLTTDIYDVLFEEFLATEDSDVIINSSQLLLDLIPSHASRQTSLFSSLLRKENFTRLLDFSLVKDIEKMTYGMDILIQILDHYPYYVSPNSSDDFDGDLDGSENEDYAVKDDLFKMEEVEMVNGIPSFVYVTNDKIPLIAEHLKDNQGIDVITYSAGTLNPPLNVNRLKLVEFLLSTLRLNYSMLVVSFLNEGIIPTLIEMFFKYDWNNFLHTLVTQIINVILETNCTELQDVLFNSEGADLLTKMVKQYNNLDGLPVRPGNLGHLTHIANNLIKASNFSAKVSKYLEDLEEWKDFQNGILSEINETEQKPLGGPKPEIVHTDDSDRYEEGDYADDVKEGDTNLSEEFVIGFSDNFEYANVTNPENGMWNPSSFGIDSDDDDDDEDDDEDNDEAYMDDEDDDTDSDDDDAFEDFSPSMGPIKPNTLPPEVSIDEYLYTKNYFDGEKGVTITYSDDSNDDEENGDEEDDVIESPDMHPESGGQKIESLELTQAVNNSKSNSDDGDSKANEGVSPAQNSDEEKEAEKEAEKGPEESSKDTEKEVVVEIFNDDLQEGEPEGEKKEDESITSSTEAEKKVEAPVEAEEAKTEDVKDEISVAIDSTVQAVAASESEDKIEEVEKGVAAPKESDAKEEITDEQQSTESSDSQNETHPEGDMKAEGVGNITKEAEEESTGDNS